MEDLAKNEANYVALSPVSFLERAAVVYAQRTSVIYGALRFTWADTLGRCRRVASALVNLLNVSRGDVVAVLAPNVPALYETHFAVPMAGGVLNTLNTRLNAANVAALLSHSRTKLLLVDYQLLGLATDAIAVMWADAERQELPTVVLIHDDPVHVEPSGMITYEDLVRRGDPSFEPLRPRDEWESIALNYTSGTTSAPKGVVYSHRGAYLSSLSMLLLWNVPTEAVYLWTLPMFHCNGWTLTWALAARGGTNVCLRTASAREIYSSVAQHRVTHLCCAPIIFNILLEDDPLPLPAGRKVEVLTGGAPPPPAVVTKVESLGFRVTHAYGLTEATGPALVCEWKSEWNNLTGAERGALKGRQGVSILSLADVDVRDTATMSSVARDGRTMGEIVLRGSSIMKGYLHDRAATAQAFEGGWLRTGDVGVVHSDGYVEIKDRSKDVIISGGENISSVEVESVLYSHPLVAEAAVVAMPHPRWGETPCAFVHTKPHSITQEEIIGFCREKLPHYMVPKVVVFMELPKTSTGKIQKFLLRDMAKKLVATPSARMAAVRKPSAPSKHQNRSVSHHSNVQHLHYVVAQSKL